MLTDNILDLIGNTPLIRLKNESVYAKAEFLNPGGSIKDRGALAMLEGAQRDGRLRPATIICETASGNTGAGLALSGRPPQVIGRQMAGAVDCFVAGVGSGGTLQGVGRFLKEHKPKARVVAVE